MSTGRCPVALAERAGLEPAGRLTAHPVFRCRRAMASPDGCAVFPCCHTKRGDIRARLNECTMEGSAGFEPATSRCAAGCASGSTFRPDQRANTQALFAIVCSPETDLPRRVIQLYGRPRGSEAGHGMPRSTPRGSEASFFWFILPAQIPTDAT